jgi:hypothetical protein
MIKKFKKLEILSILITSFILTDSLKKGTIWAEKRPENANKGEETGTIIKQAPKTNGSKPARTMEILERSVPTCPPL